MNIELIPLVSFVLITTFTPGPNNISCASMGVMFGYKTTFRYLAGIASGFFFAMILCAYLSSLLLNILPVAERYLRWVGAVYILWLAVGILKANYSFSESNGVKNAFTKGFVLQFFNPKVLVYGVTIYSTFLAPISSQAGYLSLSAAAFTLTTFLAISTWTLFGAAINMRLKNPTFKNAVNISFSLLLVYTAVELSGIL